MLLLKTQKNRLYGGGGGGPKLKKCVTAIDLFPYFHNLHSRCDATDVHVVQAPGSLGGGGGGGGVTAAP